MKKIIEKFLLAINVVLFVLTSFFGLAGLICDIIGVGYFEKILQYLNFPNGFDGFFKISYICLVIMLVIYFLRQKLKQHGNSSPPSDKN